VIIDFHTHIFPPAVRERRDEYLSRDATFAEMYASPKAKIATAEDLLQSMDEAGIDISVALGFAWRNHDLCVQHNDYLLEAATTSNGRIVAFCMINPQAGEAASKEVARCVAGGAKGLGELRPESQGWELNGDPGKRLASLAAAHDLILLFHVTELGGHEYPGKDGLQLGSFYRFAREHPELKIVGAHLAGGLPFSTSGVNLAKVFAHTYADTAARRHLYDDTAYSRLIEAIGPERVLLASDYPLVAQASQAEEVRRLVPDKKAQELILGGNGQRLLGVGANLPPGAPGLSGPEGSDLRDGESGLSGPEGSGVREGESGLSGPEGSDLRDGVP
jgi:predicted TIM-barrel fold metal-dependent hydrolase